MKRLKRITATNGVKYIDDFCGYEVFTVGWAFESNPENNKTITEKYIEDVIKVAIYIREEFGGVPLTVDGYATRGTVGDYKFSLDWENKQILVFDD